MSEMEWQSPPISRFGGRDPLFTGEVLAALRERPGQWACIKHAHAASSSAASFRRRHPNYETTTRVVGKQDNGRPLFDLYARYIGDEAAS